MEHPFDHRHHHHHHHHNGDRDGDNRHHQNAGIYPPPGVNSVSYDQTYGPPPPFGADPPPPFGAGLPPPFGAGPPPPFGTCPPPPFGTGPPPPFGAGASHHVSHDQCYDPSPNFLSSAAVPPPHLPFSGDPVRHSSHEASQGNRPGFAELVSHDSCEGGSMNQQRTVRIFTKAEENYSLSVMDGSVVLARKDPTDPRQHWIKDLKYSTKIKDEEGFPAFALVNKATGEAVKHSFGATKPVRLIPYDPSSPDESVLWSESKDLGDGFRCIRMVNNIRLNFDAFHGDENHGGVHDGTIVVLWEWLKGKNQRWKIVPY